MIKRFSIYGFLKNLQFFEPFLILFFLSLGLNYLNIALLISFRAICVNIMEIPSGALADIYGKKNAMIISLLSYIISFIIFSFSKNYLLLFPAMFFFSIGEAFRTGTHKAMIFQWLEHNNRTEEKTKIYGYTRSWSKKGSALSVLLSSLIVIFSKNYQWIFIFSIIPYIIGIWNISAYPSYLNEKHENRKGVIKTIFNHLFKSIKTIVKSNPLKKLIVQTTVFEGSFSVSKDYLQPIIQTQIITIGAVLAFPEKESTAILIGAVYFILHLLSSSASKNAHKFSQRINNDKKAISHLIFAAFILLGISGIGFYYNLYILPISCFIAYYMVQNIWRPIAISQYDNYSRKEEQATILSVESQSKSLGIIILSPIAGYLADNVGIHGSLIMITGVLLSLWLFSKFFKVPSSNTNQV